MKRTGITCADRRLFFLVVAFSIFLLVGGVYTQSFTGPLEYRGRVGFDDPKEKIYIHRFVNDGRELLIVGEKKIQRWDVENRRLIKSLPHQIPNVDDLWSFAAINQQGSLLAISDRSSGGLFRKKKVSQRVIDLTTGEQIALLERPKESVDYPKWSRNGETLVTFSKLPSQSNVETCFWNRSDLSQRKCVTLSYGGFGFPQLSSDGEWLTAVEAPPKAGFLEVTGFPVRQFVVDTTTGEIVEVILLDQSYFQEVSRDGSLILGKDDKGTGIWRTGGGSDPLIRIPPTVVGSPSLFLGYAPDNEHFVVWGDEGLEFYSITKGKTGKPFRVDTTKSRPTLRISPDNSIVGVVNFRECEDVKFYRTDTGEKVLSFSPVCKDTDLILEKVPRDWEFFQYHPTSNYLLGTSDKMLRVWDLRAGNQIQTLVAPDRLEANRKDPNRDDGLTRDAGWIIDGRFVCARSADGRSYLIWELKAVD